jgi:RNA polymerase sporulation-specific sigma factor
MTSDCYYIHTKLPKTYLTNDEVLEYIDLYKHGDEKALEILILYNMRLVIRIAGRYSFYFVENKDLISNGIIGLINAINSFNEEKNPIFNKYSSIAIRNSILAYIKHQYQETKRMVSFEDLISNQNFNEEKSLRIADKICDINTYADYKYLNYETHSELTDALNNSSLKPNEKKAVMLKCGFYDGVYTQEEIGEILKVSQRQASTYINEGYRKIRKYLDKQYKQDGTTYTKSIYN